MAQNWVNTNSTIGTASRNFIDPTAWDASFQADFRTGGGANEVGLMFADSDYTDVLLEMGPSTLTNQTIACAAKLRNAPGEKPVWKPGSGSSVGFYLAVARVMSISGIIFDGASRNITNPDDGLIIASGGGPGLGGAQIQGCTFKNSSQSGLRLALSGSNTPTLTYCLAFDNVGDGFHSTASAGTLGFSAVFCGAAFNGGFGYGFANATATCFLRNCWARSNTLGSIENIVTGASSPGNSSWIVIDDGRLTTLGATLGGADMVNVLENATQANFAFANEAGRDFTPGSGSVLLAEGAEFGSNGGSFVPFDVNNARLKFDWGDRMDVGPIQSKITVAVTPPSDTPTTAIAAFLEAIRSHFANSASFLSFIQSVNALETTNGHIFLGYDPKRITENFLKDKGPVIAVNWDSDTFEDVSLKTFDATAVISADLFYFEDQDIAHTRIAEVNFLGKMMHELLNIGFLDTTFQGQLDGVVRVAFERDEERPSIKQIHSEISVIYGSDDAS